MKRQQIRLLAALYDLCDYFDDHATLDGLVQMLRGNLSDAQSTAEKLWMLCLAARKVNDEHKAEAGCK